MGISKTRLGYLKQKRMEMKQSYLNVSGVAAKVVLQQGCLCGEQGFMVSSYSVYCVEVYMYVHTPAWREKGIAVIR